MSREDAELWVERVLVCVEQIPPGHVLSYGDVGGIVGRGPRWVGNVLARHGSGVPWWRVTNAQGEFPASLLERAYPHWVDEGIGLRPDRRGCRIAQYRPDLASVAAAYAAEMGELA